MTTTSKAHLLTRVSRTGTQIAQR